MNEAQALVMGVRAEIDEMFLHSIDFNDHALAALAIMHGRLTGLALQLHDWQPPLPPIQEQPKPAAEAKPKKKTKVRTPDAAQPRHRLAQKVECSKCGALPGVPCWRMTLGKNNKPTKHHTAGGTSHPERINFYRKWAKERATEKAIAERDPVVAAVVDKLYGAGLDGDIVDDPRFDDGTKMDDDEVPAVYV